MGIVGPLLRRMSGEHEVPRRLTTSHWSNPMDPAVAKSIREHVEGFFVGHRVTRREFDRGPIQRVAPGFHVLAVAPGPKTSLCTYVSVGGSLVRRPDRAAMEFMVIAKDDRAEFMERLAMVVLYHHSETLGVGHTFPIGQPWVPGSTLDHALVSLPYPHGPLLEQVPLADAENGQILWVLPITSAEREFKMERGLEALEQRFDQAGLRYWDVTRASVV